MELLYKRSGLPDEHELVICEVTKIFPHCVIANLIEYILPESTQDRVISGMIHISEISPGRIRNIHDFVKLGKVIVCKVLRVDRMKKQVDLSLRRVGEGQRRSKQDEIKQEQKSETIVGLIAKSLNLDKQKLYDIVSEKVFEEYATLHECFEDVVGDNKLLFDLGIDKKYAEPLTEMIKQRIKPPIISVSAVVEIHNYKPNGLEIIQNSFDDVGEDVDIKYLGAGKFKVHISDTDYKQAEKRLNAVSEAVEKYSKKNESICVFTKEEKA